MKVAVVTGSNKGIGLALVEKLAEFYKATGGWHVFLTARDEQRGHRACEQLHLKGLPVKFHQLDICDDRSRKRFLGFLTSEYAGGINVLVNNAGILYKDQSSAKFAENAHVTIGTNFTSTLDFTLECLPVLADDARHADTGDYEQHGWHNMTYGLSKLALTKATFILGDMLKNDPRRILINACCPGYVNTDMTDHKGADTPFFLATLPVGTTEPNAQFVHDRKIHRWLEKSEC
ncbi:oxidoreductase, short chain dehydrogenase/reductase family protein [Opisthorchis viverrini]|uniref:Oxidoreductase, short chain dehydrogenase/reductase family protein n=1 Tax=Opisthorchis viverrini TaxID=6198 RepID=A0A1S8XA19_OPIVI|nr:oxidoreductase, short chain dehydrogenase/reductase family protein [Opisthorchis viverrini]